MPNAQTVVYRVNDTFGPDNIGSLHEQFGETPLPDDLPLVEAMKAVGIELSPFEEEFIMSFPASMRAALRAVARSAIQRNLPLTMAWQPGYDFGVNIAADAQDTETSLGGITVILTTRYPNDPHPMAQA